MFSSSKNQLLLKLTIFCLPLFYYKIYYISNQHTSPIFSFTIVILSLRPTFFLFFFEMWPLKLFNKNLICWNLNFHITKKQIILWLDIKKLKKSRSSSSTILIWSKIFCQVCHHPTFCFWSVKTFSIKIYFYMVTKTKNNLTVCNCYMFWLNFINCVTFWKF